jgi:hypothetical protein
MEHLYTEVVDYLKDDFNKLSLDSVAAHVHNYGDYISTLMKVPKQMYRYINIPLMIHDKYINGEILVFIYDPNDDNGTLYSESETIEPESTKGFINGVKLLDEYDIREQLTANIYTGGYWDPKIYWVLDLKKLT